MQVGKIKSYIYQMTILRGQESVPASRPRVRKEDAPDESASKGTEHPDNEAERSITDILGRGQRRHNEDLLT